MAKPKTKVTQPKRSSISLQVKGKILKRISEAKENNLSMASVAKEFNLSQKTIYSIQRNKIAIEKRLKVTPDTEASTLAHNRDPFIEVMERKLVSWIDDQVSQGATIDEFIIVEMAKQLIKEISVQIGREIPFKGSKGWFVGFCARVGVKNVTQIGEGLMVDQHKVEQFKEEFAKFVVDEGYVDDQIINMDEMGLFWTKRPLRTYTTRNNKLLPGPKPDKKRLTLAVGGNASGTFKLKPFMIHTVEHPRPLAGINRETLPVLYGWNKSAWMTSSWMRWWFHSYFGPAVMKFLRERNLPEKAILLLDNAPVHPKDLEYPGITVIFMPPNTSCFIQPMDQTAIKTFKSYYKRNVMREAYFNSDGTLRSFGSKEEYNQFWKDFKIDKCIHHVQKAWNEVQPNTMRKSWKKVLPMFFENDVEQKPDQPDNSEDCEFSSEQQQQFEFVMETVLNVSSFSTLDNSDVEYLKENGIEIHVGEEVVVDAHAEPVPVNLEALRNDHCYIESIYPPISDEFEYGDHQISASQPQMNDCTIEEENRKLVPLYAKLDKLTKDEKKNVIEYLLKSL